VNFVNQARAYQVCKILHTKSSCEQHRFKDGFSKKTIAAALFSCSLSYPKISTQNKRYLLDNKKNEKNSMNKQVMQYYLF